jgi:hypothetical protein
MNIFVSNFNPDTMSKSPLIAVIFALFLFGTACKKDIVNQLPAADAGPSQTVTLPVESVSLTGTGKDADGQVVTYLWQQVSGPAASVIVDPGAPSTAVQGLIQGTYVFQLSVFDNLGGIGTDTTVITVNPSAEKTITLQPNNNPNEFSIVEIGGVDKSGPTVNSIDADAWTYNGASYTIRSIIKFDLSTIPSSATIKSAHLFLYSDPYPVNGNQHDANYGSNAFTIQQVATNWSSATTTWYNQPSGLTNNQVLISSTALPFLDLDADVTGQVGSMVNQNINYGFLLKLQTEVTYASRIFVGSHNPTYPDKHPKLVIEYN